MALTGTYKVVDYSDHPTDTVIETTTYPADLPSGSDDFDKRGTTVSQSVPAKVEEITSYDDKYYFVRAASVHNLGVGNEGNLVELSYIVGAYDSADDKNSDYENTIETFTYNTPWDYDTMTNPTQEAYNHFKSLGVLTTSSLTDV